MTRTFWLSFASEEAGFLGVAIVDVDEADAAAAKVIIAERFPHARPGAEWIGAASAKAHATGCNPGGQMLSHDVTRWRDVQPALAALPRHVLLTKAQIEAAGVTVAIPTDDDE